MEVIGINSFVLPEAVSCCLQTCNFCYDEYPSWYISVVVRRPSTQV